MEQLLCDCQETAHIIHWVSTGYRDPLQQRGQEWKLYMKITWVQWAPGLISCVILHKLPNLSEFYFSKQRY